MADEVLFFTTPKDFRAWLKNNHGRVNVQWVGYYKVATGRPSITWQESVDEALCFGWIDGVRHKIDAQAYKIRFTPRREGSVWSAKNVASAKRLVAEGRMREPGLRAYEQRREDKSSLYSYEQRDLELAAGYLAEFRSVKAAWSYYRARPPGYRRQTAHWVMSAKKEETRRRRLRQLIDCSAEERHIPQLERSGK